MRLQFTGFVVFMTCRCTVYVPAYIIPILFFYAMEKQKRFNALMLSTPAPWRLAMNCRRTTVATLQKPGTSVQKQSYNSMLLLPMRLASFFLLKISSQVFLHLFACTGWTSQKSCLLSSIVTKESKIDAACVGAEIKVFESFAVVFKELHQVAVGLVKQQAVVSSMSWSIA